jgi:hypothetical protein
VPDNSFEARVATAVHGGLEFLTVAQHEDGGFQAFELPVGVSTSWMTAHVAVLLEHVKEARSLKSAAAAFLTRHCSDPGWGYNDDVHWDLDSTAQALIVLQAAGSEVPIESVDAMLQAQNDDGGFPTFGRAGRLRAGWSNSHPDVTLVVVEALRRLGCLEEPRDRALAWLESKWLNGPPEAYWWTGEGYMLWAATFARFRVDESAASAMTLIDQSTAMPDLGFMAAAIAVAPNHELRTKSVSALLDLQRNDGSWNCEPCLRLTDPMAPVGRPVGPLFRDATGVFATAHAISALTQWRHLE